MMTFVDLNVGSFWRMFGRVKGWPLLGRLKFRSFSKKDVSRDKERESTWIKYDYDSRIFFLECLEAWWGEEKEKRIFGVLWVLGGLGVRKKKKEILRECWLMSGMVLDWCLVLWCDYVGNDFSSFCFVMVMTLFIGKSKSKYGEIFTHVRKKKLTLLVKITRVYIL